MEDNIETKMVRTEKDIDDLKVGELVRFDFWGPNMYTGERDGSMVFIGRYSTSNLENDDDLAGGPNYVGHPVRHTIFEHRIPRVNIHPSKEGKIEIDNIGIKGSNYSPNSVSKRFQEEYDSRDKLLTEIGI